MSRRPTPLPPLLSTALAAAAAYQLSKALDPSGRQLALARSEQPTSLKDGVGPVVHRKIWAEVVGSPHSAREVMDYLQRHFQDEMPSAFSWVFRRGAKRGPLKHARLSLGEKLDIRLFLTRVGKVRVDSISELEFTIRTLRQHPDAGTVCLRVIPEGGNPASHNFTCCIESVVRSSNAFDRAVYCLGVKVLQHSDWEIMMGRILEEAGGQATRHAQVKEYPYQP